MNKRYKPILAAGLLLFVLWMAIEVRRSWLHRKPNESLATNAPVEDFDEEDIEIPTPEEFENSVFDLIDEVAADPNDPQRPAAIPGVSDEELAMFSLVEIAELLELADQLDGSDRIEPRHLYQLGRAALAHGLESRAFDLLSSAAEGESPAAHAHLAMLLDSPDEIEWHLQRASEGGYGPADDMLAELRSDSSVATLKVATPPSADFGVFYRPDIIRALVKNDTQFLNRNIYAVCLYLQAMLASLNEPSTLFHVAGAEDVFLEVRDPALRPRLGTKMMMHAPEITEDLLGMLGQIVTQSITAADESENDDPITRTLKVAQPFVAGSAEFDAIKLHGRDDGIKLGRMVGTNESFARTVFNAISRFVYE